MFHAEITTFFVKGGMVDGEDGCLAITTDERQLADGWFWLVDEMTDPIEGPFLTKQDAINQAWSFMRKGFRAD